MVLILSKYCNLIAALVLVPTVCAAITGNFTKTCGGITLMAGVVGVQDMLTAKCVIGAYEDSSTSRKSTLDLNLCIGVEQGTGKLDWAV